MFLCIRAAPATADPAQLARDYLAEALRNDETTGDALVALQVSGDEDVVPLFAALSRSDDKECRLLATAALRKFAAPAAALLQRLREDPEMIIRAEALAHLLDKDAIGAD